MKINYNEYEPSPELSPFVECYWLHSFEAEENEEPSVQKCLPIGMYEILFYLDENVGTILTDGEWVQLPRSFFVGIYDNPVIWKMPGSGRLFGIRLKPETFHRLFDVPAASLYCAYARLSSFIGGAMDSFEEELYNKKDVEDMIAQAETFLANRLTIMEDSRDYIVEAANLIRRAKGNITVEEVSNTVSVGMRQLQRSFKENMGTSPKSYTRIIRFRNALTWLNSKPEWSDITYDLGYADQAHFIREFRQFAGEAPQSAVRNSCQYFKKPADFTGNLN